MKKFFEKYQIFIGIIIGALVIGYFIYLNKRPTSQPTTLENTLPPSFYQSILPVSLSNESHTPSLKSSNCISYLEAGNYVGEYKCVEGIVDNVYISRKGNVFLNFCPDYRTCPFSSVIFSSSVYKFSDPQQFKGQKVQITGLIKTYKGKPQIILDDPKQIQIIY